MCLLMVSCVLHWSPSNLLALRWCHPLEKLRGYRSPAVLTHLRTAETDLGATDTYLSSKNPALRQHQLYARHSRCLPFLLTACHYNSRSAQCDSPAEACYGDQLLTNSVPPRAYVPP